MSQFGSKTKVKTKLLMSTRFLLVRQSCLRFFQSFGWLKETITMVRFHHTKQLANEATGLRFHSGTCLNLFGALSLSTLPQQADFYL